MQPLSAFKIQKTPEGDFSLHREPPVGWENKWHHDKLGYASWCQSICSYCAESEAAWRKLVYAWAIPTQQPDLSLNDSTLFAWPRCWQHNQGRAVGGRCFWPFQWRRRLLKALWVQGRGKRNFIQGVSFCLVQQPYVQMGPRAKRDTFQFQSCSCESLITARTGERPRIYIHTAGFRNWAQNKGRETEWAPKW